MLTIYHVSDLHYGTKSPHNNKADYLLTQLKADWDKNTAANKYLLVTGDIVDDGTEINYATAMDALLPFKDKIIVIPGNHDYGYIESVIYSARAARYFDHPFSTNLGMLNPSANFFGKIPYQVTLDDHNGNKMKLIGLNSCKQTSAWNDFARGEIGTAQLGRLKEILDSDNTTPKLIALHHIPNKEAVPEMVMTLEDREQLIDAVGKRSYAFAFGHQGWFEADNKLQRCTQARKMSINAFAERKDGPFFLDANNSVDESACYKITVLGGTPNTELIRFAPQPSDEGQHGDPVEQP